MNRVRFRLAPALAILTALVALAGGAAILGSVSRSLDAAGVDAATAAQVRRDVLGVLALAGAILVVATTLAARAAATGLNRLRSALVQRARGEAAPLPAGQVVRELADLSAAAERLTARVSSREEELARGGAEVAVLLDAITEGILQLDPEGRVVRANPSARTLLGLAEGSIGQNIATHVRHAELRALLQRVAAENVVDNAEITLGERRIVVSARPLDAAQGRHGGGAVVAFVDLTEIRRLEGVRRDFVANVSHELKTPLTSIRGYVETLIGDADAPPEMRRQFLEVVQRNADRLHRIVDDLLDLSRLESGGWRPELLDVDATAVIEDVWSSCREPAARRRIRFRAPDRPVPILADPSGLRQVLTNLFDNAVRYTPDGGLIEVTASEPATVASPAHGHGPVESRPTSRLVTFEVRDNGIGIPTDALPRVFERFYRVDPARSRAEGGTGLGLSIVRHLVESMGGDVSAHSELGKGTVIRFRLPAAE